MTSAVTAIVTLPSRSINLTACIIARIYSGGISDWSQPDIAAANPSWSQTGTHST